MLYFFLTIIQYRALHILNIQYKYIIINLNYVCKYINDFSYYCLIYFADLFISRKL